MNPEDEELLQEWFTQGKIRPSTQESYMIAMNRYCNLTGKKPTELLEEAEDEEKNRELVKRRRKVRKYLLRFINKLEEEGIAPGTVNLYYYAIRSFYNNYEIELPSIKREQGDVILEENRSRGMTKENIVKLANAASPRERALIYLMALSGMGQQEARNLRIKQILEAASNVINIHLENINDLFKYEDQLLDKVLTLHIRRQKINYDYNTFIPPEASREIINYLKERSFGRNEKIRVTDVNNFVFVNTSGNKLSEDSVVTNFRRIGKKAGFKREKGNYSFWRSHSLRAYFITTFINKTGQKMLADYLAGHRISNQDRSYWQTNLDDLEKHYLKVLPHLTLDQAKVKDITSDEYDSLNKKLESKDEEIKMLQEQLNALRGDIDKKLTAYDDVFKSLENQDSVKHFNNMKFFPKQPEEGEDD